MGGQFVRAQILVELPRIGRLDADGVKTGGVREFNDALWCDRCAS